MDLPGGPEKSINISVQFAGPLDLICAWLATRLASHWNRWVQRAAAYLRLIVAVTVLLILIVATASAPLFRLKVLADTPSVKSVGPSCAASCASEETTRNIDFMEVTHSSTELGSFAYWSRATLVALGSPILLICAIYVVALSAIGKKSLCTIRIIVLRPHQRYPLIDRSFRHGSYCHVFAVRTPGLDVRRTYFHTYENLATKRMSVDIDTLQITHSGWRAEERHAPRVDAKSYWVFVRYAIGLMLPQGQDGKLQRMHFTYMKHATLLLIYLGLLTISIFLPVAGWVSRAEDSQFPLIMSGLGISWAALTLISCRKKTRHLEEWERLITSYYPFRGCSIFQNVQEENGASWIPVHPHAFSRPIRAFGLESTEFQNTVLAVMLIAYLTVLQIVK